MPRFPTYSADGRPGLETLYSNYLRVERLYKWKKITVYTQKNLPVYAFLSPKTGPSLWVVGGIHGEEPAGPIALANEIEIIARLGRHFPLVFTPLCNPLGYSRGWRYFNEPRDWHLGSSVGDLAHLLSPGTPPANPYAAALGNFFLKCCSTHPPLLTIDHHEDESVPDAAYAYLMGETGPSHRIGKLVLDLFRRTGMPVCPSGSTRFGEKITAGIVEGQPDGSFEDFAVSPPPCPHARVAFLAETPTNLPLPQRVAAHSAIITAYGRIIKLTTSRNWRAR